MSLLSLGQSTVPPSSLLAALLGVLLFLVFGFGPNLFLSSLACAVLVLGLILLWRPGEVPILFFLFLHQWAQASAAPFFANAHDLSVDQLFLSNGEHQMAGVMALLGLLGVAFGMRFGAGPPRQEVVLRVQETIGVASQTTWLKIFIIAWVAAACMRFLMTAVPGLSQLFLGLTSVKWAAFIVLTIVTFTRPDGGKTMWFAVFIFEFISSFGGYFSSFKEVFIYTIIGLGASQVKIALRRAVIVVLFISVLIWLAVIWTAVKQDYRAFLRGSEISQTVTVDRSAALAKISELVFDVDGASMSEAFTRMARRIMYTEYFGTVMGYVPSVVPHESGALWLDALTRPLTPRIFFPEKAISDESELTNAYTGLQVAGWSTGTQISLGYFAETYIDFGLAPFLPILWAIGWFLGRLYRWIMYSPQTVGLVGLALASPMLMPAAAFEVSSAKLVGGIFAQVLGAWLVSRFVVPRFLPWMIVSR